MGIKRAKVYKIIKKTGKAFAWLFGILLLLLVGAYFFIKSPACQTWLTQKIAAHYADKLGTKITIKSVDIEFFSTAVLKGIYVEDKHGDTLLYADEIRADIKDFSYSDQYVNISKIELDNTIIKLKKYAGEHGLSYRFIQDFFKDTDTTASTPSPWKVDIGGVVLRNITFAYIDTRYNEPHRGMNYDDLRITDINADISNIDPMGDSLRLRLNDLQAKEKCGLTLSSFSSLITVCDTFAKFDDLKFTTRAGCDVAGFLGFQFHDREDVADDFIHLVKMDHHFTESIIEMQDIAYFAPELKGMQKKILLTGDVKGTVDNLKCKNIDMRFGEISQLTGNFSFAGLPDFENTSMNFKIRNARTNKKDLEGIPIAPYGDSNFVQLPANVGLLGTMSFAGNVDGFLNDFVAKGTLNTGIGILKLDDLAMLDVADSAVVKYDGKMSSVGFNVGQFLSVPNLGAITGSASMAGYGFPSGKNSDAVNADITGEMSSVYYNGYNYTGVSVTDGKLHHNSFDGTLTINDPNVHLTFSGTADELNKIPKLDFEAEIDSANLGALHFLDNDHTYILSTDMSIKLRGNNIDNVEGTILVNGLQYSKDTAFYHFNELTFVAAPTIAGRRIFVDSDIATAFIEGDFQILKLPDAVRDLMSNYLPAYFPPPDAKQKMDAAQEQFHSAIDFRKNSRALQAIMPDVYFSPNTHFNLEFDKNHQLVNAGVICFDSIDLYGIRMRNIQGTFDNKADHSKIALTLAIDRAQLNDTMGVDKFNAVVSASNNDMLYKINWNNNGGQKNDGTVVGLLHFIDQNSMTVNLVKSDIHVNDTLWNVSQGNLVSIDSSTVNIKDLVFGSGKQTIGFNGRISENPTDQLNVTLADFNLAYLNYFTLAYGVKLKGTVSGPTKLSDLYHHPSFESNLKFADWWLNDRKIGDGDLDAVPKQDVDGILIHGHFSRNIQVDDPVDNIIFTGFYYPKKKQNSVDIDATLADAELDMLQPLLKDYCSMIKGSVDGTVHIGGTPQKILLSDGKMYVYARRIVVDYLGLKLNIPRQLVTIDENSFGFENFKISDGSNDTATIYGHLYHDNFENFQFDMDFDFTHFMVLNTTENDNDLYYGKVFATGYMNIFGFVDQTVSITMNAETERVPGKGQGELSEFNIPMSSTTEAGSHEFITFINPNKADSVKKATPVKNSGVDLHIVVHADDDAKVNVIFDKTVGDELTAIGTGDITIDVKPSGEFKIRGQYIVDDGSYLFTMKNVVYVPFDLGKGGTITWNGDPYGAIIDADAVYRTTASVEPFFMSDSTNQAYHRAYPVDVVMHLDSSLMNPSIAFDIYLPTADANIQETVASYIQTDLERNKQVLSLMVLNSFMTPSELRTDVSTGPDYGRGASTTLLSNFVSGTLNNWLSQISTDFNMGVKYRPNDDMTTQELKVYLGTQLLNNRMTVEMNGGKINTSQATGSTAPSQWVGDVNVNYKLTDDGKIQLLAYFRSNDVNSINTSSAPTTQGAGVLYKEEFESIGELLQRYQEAMKRKKNK